MGKEGLGLRPQFIRSAGAEKRELIRKVRNYIYIHACDYIIVSPYSFSSPFPPLTGIERAINASLRQGPEL